MVGSASGHACAFAGWVLRYRNLSTDAAGADLPNETNQSDNVVDRPDRDRPHMGQIKSPAADEEPPRQQTEVGAKGEHDDQEETRHTP